MRSPFYLISFALLALATISDAFVGTSSTPSTDQGTSLACYDLGSSCSPKFPHENRSLHSPRATPPAPPNQEKKKGRSCRRCRKCKGNLIRNSKDCMNCIPCPKGQKPDPSNRACVPDDADNEKRKQEKEDKFQKTKEKKKKERKYEATKDKKKKEFKYQTTKGKKKREFKFTKTKGVKRDGYHKNRISSQCLLLFPISLGATAGAPVVDGFFSEDFISSEDLVGIWPQDVPLPEDPSAVEKLLESTEYADLWVKVGQAHSALGVVIPGVETKRSVVYSKAEDNDNIVPGFPFKTLPHILQRRCPICGPIFRTGSSLSQSAGKVQGPLAALGKNSIKIGSGRGAKSLEAQRGAVRDFVGKINWKNCIRGSNPAK